jgi:hypothetical protein
MGLDRSCNGLILAKNILMRPPLTASRKVIASIGWVGAGAEVWPVAWVFPPGEVDCDAALEAEAGVGVCFLVWVCSPGEAQS